MTTTRILVATAATLTSLALAAPASAAPLPTSVPCASLICVQPHGRTQTRVELDGLSIQKRHRSYTFSFTTRTWVLGPWSAWHAVSPF